MSKFKVGDKVKGTKQSSEAYMITNEDMLLGEITHIYEDINGIDIKVLKHKDKKYEGEEIYCIHFKDSYFELAQPKQFTKADLKDDDKITLVNGDSFYYKNGGFTNYFYSSYDDELKRIDNLSEREIARIERPNYETVYERVEEPAKKMTVADIQKELGYKVEIVE